MLDFSSRQLAINNPPKLRRIFVCLCCYRNGRIAGYATISITAKTGKKTSKVGGWVGYLLRVAQAKFNVYFW